MTDGGFLGGSEPVQLNLPTGVELVLASGSAHRERLLAEAGLAVVVDPPQVAERELDALLPRLGAEGLALELARRKAAAVAPRHPGAWVLAADQVGTVGEGSGERLLTKSSGAAEAVAQLMEMTGTVHRLVNGLVLLAAPDGPALEGVDVQWVAMNGYGEETARRYVERFEPHDSVGSYRIEDQAAMPRAERLVASVRGEGPSGVIGLPLGLVQRLLWRMESLVPGEAARRRRS